MGRAAGLSEQDVVEVSRDEASTSYSHLDKLVLQLATVMTETPAEVPDDLRRALLDRLARRRWPSSPPRSPGRTTALA